MSKTAEKFAEMLRKPVGTTEVLEAEGKPWMGADSEYRYAVVHWERVSGGVRPREFYGHTAEEATGKALDYDQRRKKVIATWKENSKQKRASSGVTKLSGE